MRAVIVPIFSQSDLEALPNCLRYLANQGVEKLLVLHGPNVGVVNADATKEFDTKIAEFEVRERELILIKDYIGAQKAKESIETLRVERDMAVREGWKKVPDAERVAAYQKAFEKLGTEAICLREAYQHDQLFTMLQAFIPQMPTDLAHGEFSIVWPRSVATVVAKPQSTAIAPVTQRATAAPELSGRESRKAQLHKSKFMGIKSAATKAGVYKSGMSLNQLVDAVLDKEFPEPAVAA